MIYEVNNWTKWSIFHSYVGLLEGNPIPAISNTPHKPWFTWRFTLIWDILFWGLFNITEIGAIKKPSLKSSPFWCVLCLRSLNGSCFWQLGLPISWRLLGYIHGLPLRLSSAFTIMGYHGLWQFIVYFTCTILVLSGHRFNSHFAAKPPVVNISTV